MAAAALSAALVFIAAFVCIELSRREGNIAAIWFANAITLSLVIFRPRDHAGAIVAGGFVGGALANLVEGFGAVSSFMLAVANTVEVVTAVWLVRSVADMATIRAGAIGQVARVFCAAAVAAPAVGAAIGATFLAAAAGTSFAHAYAIWWFGSGAGALILLPAVTTASPRAIAETLRGWGAVRFAVLAVLTAAISIAAVRFVRFPLIFMTIPIGVAAIWFGPFATGLVGMVLAGVVIAGAELGYLPVFSEVGPVLNASLYFFVALTILVPFFLSLLVAELKRDQVRLRESERRTGSMMEHAAIGMAIVTADGSFTKVNKALADLLGYSVPELQAMRFQDVTHPDNLGDDLAFVERTLAGEIDSYRMEKRYLRRDGTVIWALLSVSIVRDEEGRAPPYFISQIVDVTERKAARAALEQLEKRWTFALESASSAVWDFDIAKNHTFYSPVWYRLFGYAPGEVAQTEEAWAAMIHPDDRERVLKANEDCMAGRTELFEQEFRMRCADGHWRWIMDRGKVIERAADGSPVRMTGIVTDISKLKEAEAALEASESRWSFALEGARQGVWDTDVRTGKSFLSPVWKGMLGYAVDEIGDDADGWLRFAHPDDIAAIRQATEDYRSGVTPYFECEFRMRHKDGHWVWVLDRGKAIERDADGRALRLIGTHTDITGRKEAEAEIRRLSRRMGLAVKAGGIGLWEYDDQTKKFWWDAQMSALYGTGDTERILSFADWVERIHPDDRQKAIAAGNFAFESREAFDCEFRVELPDGRLRHVRALADRVPEEEGQSGLMAGTCWDITEHKHLTEALFQEKDRLHITLQSIGDAVISTDIEGRVTFVNPSAAELTGWPADEALGQPLETVFSVVDEATGAVAASIVADCLSGARTKASREGLLLLSRTGVRRDIRDTAAPLTTPDGRIIGAVLVFQDMTEARRLQRQLTHSAMHDALTGLANRASFERALRAACETVAEGDREHVLGFIDLDRFKIINDTAGHAAGDALLREIGRVIRHTVRASDLTARLGGDEFGFLLYDCAVEQAELVATKIIEAIRAIPFAWDGRPYDVAASIGIAVISQASQVPGELLSQADIACYAAKGRGRARLAVYRSEESEAGRHHRDLHMAAEIRGAIENDRFCLYAQEIMPLRAGQGRGRQIEILLRMIDPQGGLIEPNAFIPAAERYDLMANIDRWVIRAVLQRYGESLSAAGDLAVFVNLSANSLNEPDFADFLSSELAASAVPAGRFNIEITETAFINNWSASTKVIAAARAAGAAIVLDDFGTGLSSFAYLKRFPVDYLKIDGSFMGNLKRNGVDRAIVESINDIAHKLGAATIAECIEDGETIEVVRAMGVDHAQGFAIAIPVPLDEVLAAEPRRPGETAPLVRRIA
jgi:diguanylate cyclase (GGDEF)-like protein/PAS domain S-box-containing protein